MIRTNQTAIAVAHSPRPTSPPSPQVVKPRPHHPLQAPRAATPVLRVAGLALFLLVGCNRFHSVEFCTVGTTPIIGDFSPEGIAIVHGQAVGFKVVPYRKDGSIYQRDADVHLSVDDPQVLEIERLDYHSPDCPGPEHAAWYFVIAAKSPGMTILRVFVNDSQREEIPVFVAPSDVDCF